MILVDHQSRISKNFFVYILRSLVDGTYYIGYALNVNERIKQHNQGKSRYTRSHRPYELVYTEAFSTKQAAKAREKAIKKYGNTGKFLKSRVPPTLLSRDSLEHISSRDSRRPEVETRLARRQGHN